MIRRFEDTGYWIELRPTSNHYEFRSKMSPDWVDGGFSNINGGIAECLKSGYKEVTMKIDPNDLVKASIPGQCCGKGYGGSGSPIFTSSSWHDSDCPEVFKASNEEYELTTSDGAHIGSVPKTAVSKRCECGSATLGSDKHSPWCPLYA